MARLAVGLLALAPGAQPLPRRRSAPGACSIASCSSATPRSRAPSSRPTASSSRSSSRSRNAQRLGQEPAEPYSAAQLVTTDTKRPIPDYFWSRDSKYILFVQDKGGDENFNVYAVDPAAAPAAGAGRPGRAQPHRRQGRARASSTRVPKNEPDIDLRRPQRPRHGLARPLPGQISTGERTLLRKNTERIAGWVFDNAGKLRLADAHHRQRRHRDPARRRRRLHEGLLVHRLRELRPGALPQGRQARLPADEQGRRRPDRAWPCSIRRPARKSRSSPTR